MKEPIPSDDYVHGQMMGMLVTIEMFETAQEAGVTVPQKNLDIIKRIASEDLALFLDKPAEDVHLLVSQQLKEKNNENDRTTTTTEE